MSKIKQECNNSSTIKSKTWGKKFQNLISKVSYQYFNLQRKIHRSIETTKFSWISLSKFHVVNGVVSLLHPKEYAKWSKQIEVCLNKEVYQILEVILVILLPNQAQLVLEVLIYQYASKKTYVLKERTKHLLRDYLIALVV